MQQHHPLASESEADVIIKNGHIATMDTQHAFVSAVAIKDGRVLATGTNEAIFAYRAAITQHPSRQYHGHLRPRGSQGWSFDCDCFAF